MQEILREAFKDKAASQQPTANSQQQMACHYKSLTKKGYGLKPGKSRRTTEEDKENTRVLSFQEKYGLLPINRASIWLEPKDKVKLMKITKVNPYLRLANEYIIDSPSPSNINYFYNFGSLLGLNLVV